MEETNLSDGERDAFLTETRVATLSYLTRSGAPFSVPIWFEWDGACAQMFGNNKSTKIRRLEHDPRARLLVARPAGEREEWVAIDGTISIEKEGVFDLVERSARRYWDLTNDHHASTLEDWRQIAKSFVRLELCPSRIRSYVSK